MNNNIRHNNHLALKTILPIAAALLMLPAIIARSAEKPFVFTPERKLLMSEQIIERFYVDSARTGDMVQDAIIAMLKTLDPHSTYSDPEETKELTTPLTGNFSGIGVQFNMLKDTLFVIQTTSGGPSEKVGILPGDRIIQAGDTVIAGRKLPNSRIIKILRGPKGSEVQLKVLRKGVAEPILFNVTRDDIPVYSIDAAYMATPTVGYIRVSRFGEETDAEFRKALADLRQQGMTDLILDLDDNGGGYLQAAHQLASHFLDKGDLVVYTDAPKMGRTDYRVERAGDFSKGRVVIMANQYSASASEILSGAIQDNDRGLIVGRRTFGKGLVQRPFPFPDGSMIRLTVSRYYTPSGRSIQKPYKPGDEENYRKDMLNRFESGEFSSADSIHMPDSLKYETLRNHRPVYGGGGIVPDLFVPIDTTMNSRYYRDLVAKGIINRYAITYVDDNRAALKARYHDGAAFARDFAVTQPMLDSIVKLGEADSIPFDSVQFNRSKPVVETVVKGLIARDLFDSTDYFRIINPVLSPSYRAALDLINDRERYERLLRGERTK